MQRGFGEWLEWSFGIRGSSPESKASRIARAAIAQIGLPWMESQPGVWTTSTEPQHGYGMRLEIFVKDEFVFCATRAAITIERPWIPQALAVALLEENNRYVYGSNRLLDGPDGMSVIHTQVCDSRCHTARQVAEVGRTVMRQMRELITRLYAEDLILTVPESVRRERRR